MKTVFPLANLILLTLVFVLVQPVSSQGVPKTPWMYYPQQQKFFYSPFCRKYKCIDNGSKKYTGTEIETLAVGDARYVGFLDLTAVRSKLGTPHMWGTGISLIIQPTIRYDEATVNLKKNYLDPDLYKLMSDLVYELIGKRYTKEQFIRCILTNKKSVDYYYLDEFLKIPSSVPIAKVSSKQGVPLYIGISCGREETDLLNISLGP